MTCSFHSDFKNMFLKAFQKYVPLVVTNFSKIVSEYLLNIDRTYKSAGKNCHRDTFWNILENLFNFCSFRRKLKFKLR